MIYKLSPQLHNYSTPEHLSVCWNGSRTIVAARLGTPAACVLGASASGTPTACLDLSNVDPNTRLKNRVDLNQCVHY